MGQVELALTRPSCDYYYELVAHSPEIVAVDRAIIICH